MEFRRIEDLSKVKDIYELYLASFPPEERVPFDSLFSGVFEGFELYALYDNEHLVAMAHLNNTENFVHVNYLAVVKEYQCQGNGSDVLSRVKDMFKGKAVVLDIEELDEEAENNHLRIRRKKFYGKNGFVQGEHVFNWEGVFMTYMHCGELDGEEFMEYIQIIFPTIINVRKRDV
ncbi:MAG: GNAT family N-acetyltransferase [Clostridiales bacterium]|nr:GNAT family N-acetyltransferase [Clostridiales bacterium]